MADNEYPCIIEEEEMIPDGIGSLHTVRKIMVQGRTLKECLEIRNSMRRN